VLALASPASLKGVLSSSGDEDQIPRCQQHGRIAGGEERLIFLCGDADGFPDELRKRAQQKISLSAMTFSHELARVMLAEQLYRAFAILSGSPYPK